MAHTTEFTSPLVTGELVTGINRGPWYETRWAGVYEGIQLSEWTGKPVHCFGDGIIGTTPQKCFAIPVEQCYLGEGA